MTPYAEKLLTRLPRLSEDTKKRNPELFAAMMRTPAEAPAIASSTKAIRQNTKPLNKAEQQALDYLQAHMLKPGERIVPHGLTLVLANGAKYTPDLILESPDYIHAYEVKAMRGRRVHVEDDAAVKIKSAACLYRRITFVLIWHDKQTGHQMQIVKP